MKWNKESRRSLFAILSFPHVISAFVSRGTSRLNSTD